MNVVTIGLTSDGDAQHRLAAAFRGEAQGARISFASAELLWQVLTARRWYLLQAMSGQGKDKQQQQGAGLGLYIAKNLAEINHCELSITSTEDVGTKVTLNIPTR